MKRANNSIEISEDHRDQLKQAREQTGCGASAFLKWAKDVPSGLTGMTIEHWMQGRTKTADNALLMFVLTNWPEMPKKVPITDELVRMLRSEEARTGLVPKRLIATMDEVPDGLTALSVSMWMNKRVKQAWQEQVDAILKAYANISSE